MSTSLTSNATSLDELCVSAVRVLAMDAVERAGSGHASMLLYSVLHLTGYDLPLEELERFRQWASQAPGHPSTE